MTVGVTAAPTVIVFKTMALSQDQQIAAIGRVARRFQGGQTRSMLGKTQERVAMDWPETAAVGGRRRGPAGWRFGKGSGGGSGVNLDGRRRTITEEVPRRGVQGYVMRPH